MVNYKITDAEKMKNGTMKNCKIVKSQNYKKNNAKMENAGGGQFSTPAPANAANGQSCFSGGRRVAGGPIAFEKTQYYTGNKSFQADRYEARITFEKIQ